MPELILVVDDEQDLTRTLVYALEREGFAARTAHTGEAALELAHREPLPALVLLDLMLPDIPGTEVCRRLRASERTGSVPVIMLTAKSDEIDRVVGFEVGADDYVAKPFSVRELMLRVRALLRRTRAAEPELPVVTFGRLRLDREGHRVWVDGAEVVLTALELKLLSVLLERKGRVQTRERLLSDVWGIDAEQTTRTVDTHVRRLRQKLGPAAAYVETMRGVGYRMCSEPPEAT